MESRHADPKSATRKEKVENNELKYFVVSLLKKYFVTFLLSFCRFLYLQDSAEILSWIFIGCAEALMVKHLNIVEASYHTGRGVGVVVSVDLIRPNKQISLPVVALPCFIVEEILSA